MRWIDSLNNLIKNPDRATTSQIKELLDYYEEQYLIHEEEFTMTQIDKITKALEELKDIIKRREKK